MIVGHLVMETLYMLDDMLLIVVFAEDALLDELMVFRHRRWVEA